MRLALCLTLALAVPGVAQEKKGTAPQKKAPPATAEELVQQADERIAAGDLDGAAELLRRAVDLGGESGDPELRLGRLLESRYELDAAIDAYKGAGGKLTGATKGEALARLAVAQEMRGSAEAGASAEAAASADPEGAWTKLALARARARAGQADEALALAADAVAKGGGALAVCARGFAYEAKGDLASAEKDYREALAAPEAKVAAGIGLARVLRKSGRPGEAEPILAKTLEAAPGAVSAYKESARVKIALNRPDEAMGDAATAAALAENDPEAQRLAKEVAVAKALASVAAGQADVAIQELTALRDQSPDFADARVGLAKAYVAKRQLDAAQAELKKAVEIDPASAEAWYQLAYVTHVLKGDGAGAVAPYEKAVAAEPGSLVYRTGLGAALTAAGQFDRAVAELKKVTETRGYERPEAWIYLGQAQIGAKRYKDAVAPLEKATQIAPQNDQAWAFLGWAYFGLKDADNFKKAAGKAKALGHKEPTLLQYLQRVEAGEPIK
jgi:tetratricopeptide (TPR) repeat protein